MPARGPLRRELGLRDAVVSIAASALLGGAVVLLVGIVIRLVTIRATAATNG